MNHIDLVRQIIKVILILSLIKTTRTPGPDTYTNKETMQLRPFITIKGNFDVRLLIHLKV